MADKKIVKYATETGKALMETIRDDIDQWFTNRACHDGSDSDFFFSEIDMQIRLSLYLMKTGHYRNIIPEYKVPQAIYEERLAEENFVVPTPIYPWQNDMRIDIVAEGKDAQEYVVIELKYITAALQGKELFGEPIDTDILKDHDATNLLQYNCLKDVRRIEMLTRIFPKIVGGLAVIVTNNLNITKPPKAKVLYSQFSLYKDRIIGSDEGNMLLDWEEIDGKRMNDKTRKDYPEFIIDGKYVCKWQDVCPGAGLKATENKKYNHADFKYLILQIDKGSACALYQPNHFTIGSSTTADQISKWFKQKYNLVLKIYDKSGLHILQKDTLLCDHGAKKGTISFRTSIMVGTLENKFKNERNLNVKIFTKDAWVHVLPDISIANAEKIPAGATKAKMEKYRSYKRKIKIQ